MSVDFFEKLRIEYHIDLNEQQREVVTHNEGPCLILAVPGGGKTTTLLARTAYLIDCIGISPANILSITFSRASANDMKKRYYEIFSCSMNESKKTVSFATIHSFSYRVVMGHAKANKLSLKLIEKTDSNQWSKIVILKNLYHKFNREYISDSDLDSLMNDISYIKNMMYDHNQIKAYKSDISFFTSIYEAYEQLKVENDFIDFDDMLAKCVDIFEQNPGVLAAYQEKFKYVQVDEAQDTSILQHKIIEMLVQNHQNVFYVADDDQSIYGFRAAYPNYLLQINKKYLNAKIYKMEENYRSTKEIVNICNTFIKTNTKRYDKNIITNNKQGEPIEIVEVEQRFEQMDMILKKQIESYKDVAILYRNNHSAIPIVKKLIDKHIPFYMRDFSTRFFSHWVVSDLLNILEFAQNPINLDSFLKFYYKLRGYYISKLMVDNCSSKGTDETVTKSLKDYNLLNDYQVDNVEKLERHFFALSMKAPSPGIDYILDVMGYREFLMDRASTSDATYDTYLDMIRVLKNLSEKCMNTQEVKENIENLKQEMSQAANNQGKNAVTITTIHSSKGLEWDQVYVLDLQEGIFPNRDIMKEASENKIDKLEEERRLFYVAMTRAKRKLCLMSVKELQPSIFLQEVNDLLFPEKKAKREKMNQQIQSTKYVGKENEKPAYWKINVNGVNKSDHIKPLILLEKDSNIIHKTFGEGTVVQIDYEYIVIQFKDKPRKLGYHYCMEQNLIELRPN